MRGGLTRAATLVQVLVLSALEGIEPLTFCRGHATCSRTPSPEQVLYPNDFHCVCAYVRYNDLGESWTVRVRKVAASSAPRLTYLPNAARRRRKYSANFGAVYSY
jgi:hypothetical protein